MLPTRIELVTLALLAPRSNQLSYGSCNQTREGFKIFQNMKTDSLFFIAIASLGAFIILVVLTLFSQSPAHRKKLQRSKYELGDNSSKSTSGSEDSKSLQKQASRITIVEPIPMPICKEESSSPQSSSGTKSEGNMIEGFGISQPGYLKPRARSFAGSKVTDQARKTSSRIIKRLSASFSRKARGSQ
jgi:hypothetical protein